MGRYFKYFSILIILLLSSTNSQSQSNSERRQLELHQILESSIRVQEQDEYLVVMDEKQTAIVRIERGSFELGKEINLLLTIISPDDKIVVEINTANDASFVIFDSTVRGNYKVVVRRWNGAESGGYKIVLDYLENTNPSKVNQIDQLLSPFYEPNQPGASFLIQKEGKIIYKKHFGLSNLNFQIQISDSTIFDIASVSKQVVAFSIAMLAVEEKINLDNSIRKYIPEFPKYGEDISVLHLVLNISGLKDYDQILALSGYLEEEGDNITRQRILSTVFQFKDTYFKSGTNYRYSNSGYFLLTEIIERVTGKSYPQWVKENIFAPLQMNSSFIFENDNSVNKNISNSYKKKRLYDHIKVPPSTYQQQPKNLEIYTVHTTVEDFGKWINNYRDGKVGGKKTLELIELGIHQDPDSWNWAFGFQKTKYKGISQKLSTGIIQGYRSYATYFPDEDISLILFSNDGEWRTFYLANKIIDVFVQPPLQDEIKSSYSFESDKKEPKKTDEINDSKIEFENSIEGNYSNFNISKNLRIVKNKDGLQLKLFGLPNIPLETIAQSEFKTNEWYMSKVVFIKGESEKIEACKIYNSRNGDFVLFHKN